MLSVPFEGIGETKASGVADASFGLEVDDLFMAPLRTEKWEEMEQQRCGQEPQYEEWEGERRSNANRSFVPSASMEAFGTSTGTAWARHEKNEN
jgi:hypothetical protein